MTTAVCLFVIVVLLVAFCILFINIRSVTRQTSRLLDQQTQMSADDISEQLSSYSRLCEILAANVNLQSVAASNVSPADDTELFEQSYSLRKDMTNLISIYGSEIKTLAAYFVRSGAVITMARLVEPDQSDLFFNTYPDLSPASLEALAAGLYWNVHYQTEQDPHCWISFRVQTQAKTVAYVLVEFDLDRFVERSTAQNALVLIGDGKHCLYSSGNHPEDASYASIYENAAAGKSFVLDGIRYIASIEQTRIDGNNVLVAVPITNLQQIEWTFALVIVVTSAIVFLCIAVLSSNLNSRLFTPVEKLMDAAHRQGDYAQKALYLIKGDLISIRNENEQMLKERDSILPLALGRQLAHLVAAPNSEQAAIYAQSCLILAGIQSGERYAMFAISCVEDGKNFFRTMSSDPRLQSQEGLFHYLLNNVLADLLFKDHPGTVAPFHENWFLVLVACGSAVEAEQIESVIPALQDFYSRAFSAVLVSTDILQGIAPSNFIESVLTLSRDISYLDFWGSTREERIESTEASSTDFSYYCRLIRKLINRIDIQDYEGIPEMIDHVLDCAIPSGVENLQIAKYRIYTMVALIITAIDEQLGDEQRPNETLNFEDRLYQAENINDFKRELHAILSELVELKKMQETKIPALSRMEEIKQYILLHSSENSLTATSIAAHFQMSNSYLSRAFKEHTGVNILEYIQRLRVEAAKPLLLQESVKSVAQKVGFWDAQGLTRAFKKYEGISPNEYKRMIEKQADLPEN